MIELQRANRSNMLLGLARCCGTQRTESGKSTTLLPLTRMPTGLIEYQINFFTSSHKSQARIPFYICSIIDCFMQMSACPPDYLKWCETMFHNFGHRWMSLHRGPCWQCFPPLSQSEMVPGNVSMKAKLYTHVPFMSQAKINNAAPSISTLQRRRALSGFSKGSGIQVNSTSCANALTYERFSSCRRRR